MTSEDNPGAIPDPDQSVAASSRTAASSRVFASLDSEWTSVASSLPARRALRAWAVAAPRLDGFASPAALVATIGRRGQPTRSCALLSDLLIVADQDELAARAVLQAILPGLRSAARRRWRPTRAGPWAGADEVAADAVSTAWATITLHAGQHHDRPAAVIIRAVEGHLRRTHDAWRRQTDRIAILPAIQQPPSQSGLTAARTAKEQAAVLITEASRAGVLDQTEAGVLFAVGVLGYTVAEVSRITGTDSRAAYRTLERARASLRAWVADRPDVVTPHAGAAHGLPPRRSPHVPAVVMALPPPYDHLRPIACPVAPLLVTPLQAAGLLGISRSKMYALVKAGEIHSLTIGAARRIPYSDLVDYVERRRQEDGRWRHPPTTPKSDRTALDAPGTARAALRRPRPLTTTDGGCRRSSN